MRREQQGVVLIVALIALVAMSLAAIALVRTVDTSNVVSGNISFNEAVIQMADAGAEQAYLDIRNNTPYSTFNWQTSGNGPAYFYTTLSSLDPVTRLPAPAGGLNWSAAIDVTLPGQTAKSGYSTQYVIERMCQQTGQPSFVKNGVANCTALPVYDSTTGALVANQGRLFYRVTVQVNGPRNTRALAQYFYTAPWPDNGVMDAL